MAYSLNQKAFASLGDFANQYLKVELQRKDDYGTSLLPLVRLQKSCFLLSLITLDTSHSCAIGPFGF